VNNTHSTLEVLESKGLTWPEQGEFLWGMERGLADYRRGKLVGWDKVKKMLAKKTISPT